MSAKLRSLARWSASAVLPCLWQSCYAPRVAFAQAEIGPALVVNTAASRHPISPNIYGINDFAADKGLWTTDHLPIPVQRWGGDNTSNYNWLVDSTNAGADSYFIGGGVTSPITPGAQVDSWVSFAKNEHAKSIVTVPLTGWVNKYYQTTCSYPQSLYPGQDSYFPPFEVDFLTGSICGNGTINGNSIEDINPARNYIPVDPDWMAAWYDHFLIKYGDARRSGVIYQMDNEPEYWNYEHADVHFNTPGWAELANDAIEYGGKAKQIDRTAEVMGPVNSSIWPLWDPDMIGNDGVAQPFGGCSNPNGNCGYNPQAAKCAGNTACPFFQFYLTTLKKYEAEHGRRLLDYFDVHYYPNNPDGSFQLGQVPAADGLVFPASDATASDGYYSISLNAYNDIGTEAAALRTTRALWDPTYINEDYTGLYFPTTYGNPMLIRRLRSWVDQYYPGTKISISEYNWGGGTGRTDIVGVLAQADVLGIFGREGLDLATMWGPPAATDSIASAFKVYLNYDGKGSRFGDVSVESKSVEQGTGKDGEYVLSIYGAKRSSDDALTLMVINKSITMTTYPYATSGAENLRSTLTIQNFTPESHSAQVYQVLSTNATTVSQQIPATLTEVAPAHQDALPTYTLTYTFPANSITLLVVPSGHKHDSPREF
jgi:Glycoside hydrolase family 44